MPGGLAHQGTRKQEEVRRRIDANDRKGRRVPHRDGSGRSIENVTIAAADFLDVEHGLGVVPRGWQAVNVRFEGTPSHPHPYELCEADGSGTFRSKTILRLHNASASTMHIDVWVY